MTTNLESQQETPATRASGDEAEATNPLFGFNVPGVWVGLITIAAFLPVLRNGFVAWDETLIVHNANLRGWGPSEWFWMFTDVKTAGYQPVTWFTFKLDHLIWGMDPFGFHFTNLILHGLTAMGFYFLVSRLLSLHEPGSHLWSSVSAKFVAVFAALAFGLHPLRVEPVALAAARADLLCGLFVLLSVLSRLHGTAYESDDRRRIGWLGASFGCYALSLFTSVKGLALPLVWLLLDRYRMKTIVGAKDRQDPQHGLTLKQSLAWFGIGLVVVGLPRLGSYFTGEAALSDGSGIAAHLISILAAPAFYVWKSLVPSALSLYYDFPTWDAGLLVFGFAVSSGAIIYHRKNFPSLLLCGSAYLLFILPGMFTDLQNLPAISDRNSYLPAMPLTLLLVALFVEAFGRLAEGERLRRAKAILRASSGALVAALFLATWNQTQAWSDTETLLKNSARGGSPEAHFQLAAYLEGRERIDDAVAHFRRAAAIAPSRWDAHERAGVLLYKQGRIPEAVPHLRLAVANHPSAVTARENLASALMTTGAVGEAIEQFRKVLEFSPEFNEARLKLATILALEGWLEESTALFRQAVDREPDDAKIHSKLGEVLAAQGQLDAAVQAFRKAVALQPADAEIQENLGRALNERGFREEGAQHLREALRILRSTPAAR